MLTCAKSFYNRKGSPSIQLQLVVDDTLSIRSLCTRLPGSWDDRRVFKTSVLYRDVEDPGDLRHVYVSEGQRIVADGAQYKTWIVAETRDAVDDPAAVRRNASIANARHVVERSKGLLKFRFRVLYCQSEFSLASMMVVIEACCILHNLCIAGPPMAPDEEAEAREFIAENARSDMENRSLAPTDT